MFKKIPYKKILPIICLAVIAWVGMGGVAWAQGDAVAKFLGIGDFTIGFVFMIVGYILYTILTIASFCLSLAAIILNFSVYLTTHLQIFINNTPAIREIWMVLRDFSSMILIFAILYASIQMILNLKSPAFGELLKNIIVAGILINFSFFFAQTLIDASNIVSLEFYNALSSSESISQCEGPKVSNSYLTCAIGAMTSINGNGGIANVFMGALDINQWWSNKGLLQSVDANSGLRIILVNSAALVITIMATISFIGAAAATLWRTVILVLLLAFSPLWIAGFALPQLKKEVSDKWWGQFKANLLFLPVYLFLTYIVIKIIMAMNLGSLGQTAGTLGLDRADWFVPYLQLSIGFTIAIFLINLPLVTAISFAGASGSITDKFSGWAKGWAGGVIGRNTLGRAAYALNKSETMSGIAKWSPTAGIITSRGLSKVGSAGFGGKKGGYESGLKKEKADIEGMHKQIGESIKRSNYATDEEYDNAKKAAQGTFRSNLASPLGFLPQTNVFNRLIAGRGRLESATKLNKEAGKQDDKDEAKKARSAMNDVNKTISALRDEEDSEATDAELKSLLTKIGESEKVNAARKALGLESITQSAEQRVTEIKGNQQKRKEQIKELQKIAQKLGEVIRKGEDVEKEEKDQTITKKLDEILKREGSGESSKPKKEEKPA